MTEIPTPKRQKSVDTKLATAKESLAMLNLIPKNSFVIALDEHGEQWDTMGLAKHLQTWQENHQQISLLIGGPDGLSTECLARANVCWSLSKLTLPHQLARIVAVEQLYRAWTILNKHPYHRI